MHWQCMGPFSAVIVRALTCFSFTYGIYRFCAVHAVVNLKCNGCGAILAYNGRSHGLVVRKSFVILEAVFRMYLFRSAKVE